MKMSQNDFDAGTKKFGGGPKKVRSLNEIWNHFSCSPQKVFESDKSLKISASHIYNSYAGLVNFDDHHVSTMLEKLYHFLENELIF